MSWALLRFRDGRRQRVELDGAPLELEVPEGPDRVLCKPDAGLADAPVQFRVRRFRRGPIVPVVDSRRPKQARCWVVYNEAEG